MNSKSLCVSEVKFCYRHSEKGVDVIWKTEKTSFGGKILSPDFKFADAEWQLGTEIHTEKIDVFLKCNKISSETKFRYRFFVKDDNIQFQEKVDSNAFSCGVSRGFVDFLNFTDSKKVFCDGTLTIICQIRNPKYEEEVTSDVEKCLETAKLLEKQTVKHDVLSDNLKVGLENEKHSDVVLKLGEVAFPAHKMILSCRSKVFEAMFDHKTKESLNNIVDLVDMDVAVAKMMLKYIYTGKVEELSVDNMIDLYSVADRYCLMELLDQCREFIIEHMNVDNACDVAIAADLHSDDHLMREVQDFFHENIKSILQTKKREMMFEKYSKLYIKLVETAILLNDFI